MNEEREPDYSLAERRHIAWDDLKDQIVKLPKRFTFPYTRVTRRTILRIALADMVNDVKTIIDPRRRP